MASVAVAKHPADSDLVLFINDEGKYWIGCFDSRVTRHDGEPPFHYIDGIFDTVEEGIAVLFSKIPMTN